MSDPESTPTTTTTPAPEPPAASPEPETERELDHAFRPVTPIWFDTIMRERYPTVRTVYGNDWIPVRRTATALKDATQYESESVKSEQGPVIPKGYPVNLAYRIVAEDGTAFDVVGDPAGGHGIAVPGARIKSSDLSEIPQGK